jgi:hypothetical protein
MHDGASQVIAVDAGLVEAIEDVEVAARDVCDGVAPDARDELRRSLNALGELAAGADAASGRPPLWGAVGTDPVPAVLGATMGSPLVVDVPARVLGAAQTMVRAAHDVSTNESTGSLDALSESLRALDEVRGTTVDP